MCLKKIKNFFKFHTSPALIPEPIEEKKQIDDKTIIGETIESEKPSPKETHRLPRSVRRRNWRKSWAKYKYV